MNELTRLAMKLPETERAHLAADLLASLPGPVDAHDEEVVEALRRDAELEDGTHQALSLDDINAVIRHSLGTSRR